MVETHACSFWDHQQRELLLHAREVLDFAGVKSTAGRVRTLILSAGTSPEEVDSEQWQHDSALCRWLEQGYRRLQAGQPTEPETRAFENLTRYWLVYVPRLSAGTFKSTQAAAVRTLCDFDEPD